MPPARPCALQDWVTEQPSLIPLAGPANRQGRIAADVIMGKEPSKFRGTQATAVVGVFEATAAATGASERTLKRCGIPFLKVYIHAANHARKVRGWAALHVCRRPVRAVARQHLVCAPPLAVANYRLALPCLQLLSRGWTGDWLPCWGHCWQSLTADSHPPFACLP